jgi:hypothetical protein
MVTIRLPTSPTDQQFEKLAHQWDSATDAEIALPRKMTDSERDLLDTISPVEDTECARIWCAE